jgi:DNA-binding transcriptional LysR family regulator
VSDVTRVLDRLQQGDPRAAEELLPLVYQELRRLAAQKMAQELPGQTLQPTALVHEAWLRLVGSGQEQWDGRERIYLRESTGQALPRRAPHNGLVERGRVGRDAAQTLRVAFAGVQIGEFIQRDMIAVRVSEDLRLAVVGSPEYFKARKIPRTPRDLKDHACIGFRFSSGIYRWEFEKGRKALTVNPQGPATFDDPDLVVQAVLNGVGIATTVEQPISEMIAKGRLVQVLKDWCPTFPGYFLYYPSRRNQPAALAALINTLRLSD